MEKEESTCKGTGNADVSGEGLAPIVKAYSRLIPVDGLVL